MSSPPHGSPAAGELEELLRPTVIAEHEQSARSASPWRLGSQFYVVVFGGAAGVTVIALLNAARLGLPAGRRRMIAALGVGGVTASAIVIAAVGLDDDGGVSDASILGRVVGVAAWAGMYLVQRSAHRLYEYRTDEDEWYAPMWVPGLLAMVAGSAVQLTMVGLLLGTAA